MTKTKKPKGTVSRLATPYRKIRAVSYQIEKRRLQYELLRWQQNVVRKGRRVAIVFEGRDAAGKGATIKRCVEHMMPRHYRVVELGVPSDRESKNWFRRYQIHMPRQGEIVFFDRSWYTRALIEPTMGYCSKSQYTYFMKKVVDWEENLVEQGTDVVKFYLSVNLETQLIRFNRRLHDPLKYWKISENDLKAQRKWERFSKYKEQMFARTSSAHLPWVVVNSNSKREAALTCMLHLVRHNKMAFVPLTGEMVETDYEFELHGVKFKGLSAQQYAVMAGLAE